MSALILTGLVGAIPKVMDDITERAKTWIKACFMSERIERLCCSGLQWTANVILFWLVVRVCCCACFAWALDTCFPRRPRWLHIGDFRTSAKAARIMSARSRFERFLFEQLYLARRVPCAEEFEAVCAVGRVYGDPAIVVEFAPQSQPTGDAGKEDSPVAFHDQGFVARVTFSRHPRMISADAIMNNIVVGSESPPTLPTVVEFARDTASGTQPVRQTFPFPFGAIDLAEIYSRVWPSAAPLHPTIDASAAIARARMRRERVQRS